MRVQKEQRSTSAFSVASFLCKGAMVSCACLRQRERERVRMQPNTDLRAHYQSLPQWTGFMEELSWDHKRERERACMGGWGRKKSWKAPVEYQQLRIRENKKKRACVCVCALAEIPFVQHFHCSSCGSFCTFTDSRFDFSHPLASTFAHAHTQCNAHTHTRSIRTFPPLCLTGERVSSASVFYNAHHFRNVPFIHPSIHVHTHTHTHRQSSF